MAARASNEVASLAGRLLTIGDRRWTLTDEQRELVWLLMVRGAQTVPAVTLARAICAVGPGDTRAVTQLVYRVRLVLGPEAWRLATTGHRDGYVWLGPVALPARGLDVLIVDDDSCICSSIERCLRVHSYDVESAGTFGEGRKWLLERRFLVAFIDLGLPGGSGLDLVALARSIDAELDIVMITGTLDHNTLNAACLEHDAYFCHKPFDAAGLVRVVDRAAERAARTGVLVNYPP